VRLALNPAESALHRLAGYELEPAMARRPEALSDRKEFLTDEEHAELLGLVDFARRRTIEKLEAQIALKQLHQVAPEMVSAP
jgi:hypothetical protein